MSSPTRTSRSKPSDAVDQAVEHLEADLQARIGRGHQRGDGGRHHVAAEAEAAADAQPPARLAFAFGDLVEQAVEIVEDGLGAGQHRSPSSSAARAAWCAGTA
jgi:hypothetical protein